MGANAQTAVPVFTAGQVLTAQQQTEINTGIPVFATTVTRDAACGGAGEKTLAEGQFAYIEATNTTQYYDGAAWQSVGATSGLIFITGASFTTVTSVSLPTNTFTSTYRNYRIIFDITGCTSTATITGRVRISGTDQTGSTYFQCSPGLDAAGNTNNLNNNASTSFSLGGVETNGYLSLILDAVDPQINRNAHTFTGNQMLADGAAPAGNKGRSINLNYSTGSSTQIDSFSFISSIASSISGVYRIYAYSES